MRSAVFLLCVLMTGCSRMGQEFSAEEWLPRVVVLGMLLAGLIVQLRFHPGRVVGSLLIWAIIGFVLILLYSFRAQWEGAVSRVRAELFPTQARTVSRGVVELTRAQDGHFHVQAIIDDRYKIEFLFDTGASKVVISRAMAKRLGVDMRHMRFSESYNTANGVIRAAPILFKRMRVGDIDVENVAAAITDSELDTPLLGMSFMSKLSAYEIRGDRLVMRTGF